MTATLRRLQALTPILRPVLRLLPQARHLSTAQPNRHEFDHKTDVLIIGSGAAGLTAALRTHSHGLSCLIIEKDAQVGGTSAYSGGGLWIPNNPLAVEAGITDSPEQAMTYLTSIIDCTSNPATDLDADDDVRRASSPARKHAFLTHGPRMVSFLQDQGFAWRLSPGRQCPDYYPRAPGALLTGGRSIEPDAFDARQLGLGENWTETIRQRPGRSLPLFTYEASSVTRMGSSWWDFGTVLRVLIRSAYLSRVRGQIPVTMGRSLVAQLLWLNMRIGQQVLTETALRELIPDAEGGILGARVATSDGERTIHARRGVLLCAGGFAHNQALRERYGPAPANAEWTSAAPGDDGDGIVAGVRVSAATALMDEAWWGPTLRDPVRGMYYFALQERARPFSVIVDSSGKRFMNEAEPYTDAGHHQYARQAIPAWFIFDWNHRKRYAVGSLMPRQQPPAQALAAGYIHRAETISELARQIGVDEDGLQGTLARFNEMADRGVDADFSRGESAFDNYFWDPRVRPNPNLGAVRTPPFYAIPVVPGDLGTKGGLLTDEHARVIRENGGHGAPVPGLYAAGNTTASVMGRTYPGAGTPSQLHANALRLHLHGGHLDFGVGVFGINKRLEQVDGLLASLCQQLLPTGHGMLAKLHKLRVGRDPAPHQQREGKHHKQPEIDPHADIDGRGHDPFHDCHTLPLILQRVQLPTKCQRTHNVKRGQLQVVAVVHLDCFFWASLSNQSIPLVRHSPAAAPENQLLHFCQITRIEVRTDLPAPPTGELGVTEGDDVCHDGVIEGMIDVDLLEVDVSIGMEVSQGCGDDPAGEAGIDRSEGAEAREDGSWNPVKGRKQQGIQQAP
ncbi:hypothetical protein CNMCM5793_004725 [Aspergillus hiratsukae]|uniref:FAD-dependent oxidoreductase 2 FAD-binding domain-containing protein n=1 Tax=Aspergillus hiratsukae TaxID=1194566 RepID=A0A8H6PFG1_9EURO|nr:hypothetical protein CNMCM5793_004725 [Aspergillus hiratsukae]KAF7170221.1 hypothetical protein CNMCM6106_004999 [Aspergillus hiratsukae]